MPSLRNVELTGPYFHNGSESNLIDVVLFYTRGGNFPVQSLDNLAPNIDTIGHLREHPERVKALAMFLLSLTDERVRFRKAPFDHPQLFLPNGHPGDEFSVTDDGTGEATDDLLEIAAVGAGGSFVPLNSFLDMQNGGITSVPAPGHNLVFLASDWVKINRPKGAFGDVHSNGKIDITSGGGGAHTGNMRAVERIVIESKNTINGDIFSGEEVFLEGSATVNGMAFEHFLVSSRAIPEFSFEAGGSDHTVSKKGALSLPPGSYDKVKVKKKGELSLFHNGTTGAYFFNILDTDRSSKLLIDVRKGPVTLNIVKELDLDRKIEVVITPGGETNSKKLTFNILNDDKIQIGKYSRVLGTIIGQDAEVHFDGKSTFRGEVCADIISVDPGTIYMHHETPGVLPKIELLIDEEDDEEAIASTIVEDYELSQNFPNPFNPSTTIRFALIESRYVTLAIYNSTGQLVRILANEDYEAGWHRVVWDGNDNAGRQVASGLYLYRIKAGDFVAGKKLVLMK